MTVAGNLSSTKRILLERMLAGQVSTAAHEPEIPRNREPVTPLSPEQMNIWTHAASVSAQIYNEPITLRRSGPFDLAVFTRALNEFLRRHEAWRSAIEVAEGQPRLRVHDSVELNLS